MGLHLSDELRSKIREDSQAMCGYCQTQESIIGFALQIAALDMNNALIVRARFRWVQAGWHPPSE